MLTKERRTMGRKSNETKPRKEKSDVIGFNIPFNYTDRLVKLGLKGTVSCLIVKQFLAVRELETKNRPSSPITAADGTILYGADLGEDIHHLVIKQGQTTIIAELSAEDIANYIVTLVELLNNKPIR